MPVRVEGDCQWGVNKVEKRGGGGGWLVWIINNKGVEKFSNEPERYDLSQTAEVRVIDKVTGRTVVVKVRPGAYELVDLN